jgi:hypothetical protein
MESIHDIWKKSDLSLIAKRRGLTSENLQELQNSPEEINLLNSLNLTFFFEDILNKNSLILISHPDVAREMQALGMETSPGAIPATDFTQWIQLKSRFVSTFERQFRNRYPIDSSPARERIRRAALKVQENLGLRENLLSKDALKWEPVNTENRNASIELNENLTNTFKKG